LRLPSALSIYHDELAVAELDGRVTVLDKDGKVIATIGQNDHADQTKTNKAPPEIWQDGLFYAPHGVTYDKTGNLWVTEFNQYGRVTHLTRK
jgi:DNA-binding beta-propeller fold protein YncE